MLAPPGMTSRGKRISLCIALAILFFLPKHVECGYPGGECGYIGDDHRLCKTWELEPLGLFLVEKFVDSNVGFAYKRGVDCR